MCFAFVVGNEKIGNRIIIKFTLFNLCERCSEKINLMSISGMDFSLFGL